MQDKNKRCVSVCETGVLAVLPKGPAPPVARHGLTSPGRSPEESGPARQPAFDFAPFLSACDGDEASRRFGRLPAAHSVRLRLSALRWIRCLTSVWCFTRTRLDRFKLAPPQGRVQGLQAVG